MLSNSRYILLILILTRHTALAVFTRNGHGCADSTISDFDERNGELWVRDKYDHDCDWSLTWPDTLHINAIIMHIMDVWIDCTKGYLRFKDRNGLECGLCEQIDEPTSFCQIYVEDGVCTEDEIWGAVLEQYPSCTSSVIHTGTRDLRVHLVTMGASWREFTLEYNLHTCKGSSNKDTPLLGLGHIHTSGNYVEQRIKQFCPIVVETEKEATTQTPKENITKYDATEQSLSTDQLNATANVYNVSKLYDSHLTELSHHGASATTKRENNAISFTEANISTNRTVKQTTTELSIQLPSSKSTSSTKHFVTVTSNNSRTAVKRQNVMGQYTPTERTTTTSRDTNDNQTKNLIRTSIMPSDANEFEETTTITLTRNNAATAVKRQNATGQYPLTGRTTNMSRDNKEDQTKNLTGKSVISNDANEFEEATTITQHNIEVEKEDMWNMCWIIIIILAALLLLSILTIIFLLLKRKKRKKKYPPAKTDGGENADVMPLSKI